ncbi:MAG: phasin family protein [Methylocella sp.]
MDQKRAQVQPADPRIDGPINGSTPATRTVQAFALTIAGLSLEVALARTAQHMANLRKANSMEEIASLQLDFVKQCEEHAAEHKRKLYETLAALPLEMGKTCQDDLL